MQGSLRFPRSKLTQCWSSRRCPVPMVQRIRQNQRSPIRSDRFLPLAFSRTSIYRPRPPLTMTPPAGRHSSISESSDFIPLCIPVPISLPDYSVRSGFYRELSIRAATVTHPASPSDRACPVSCYPAAPATSQPTPPRPLPTRYPSDAYVQQ